MTEPGTMDDAPAVLALADLRQWSERPRVAGPQLAVIGNPVAHSRSPQMHNPALVAAGLGGRYHRLHLRDQDLDEAIPLMRAAGFHGFNVTIPHKTAIHDRVDEMSETARRIGAVNTVLIDGDRLVGHNTDAPGLRQAVREAFSMDLADLRVMIIGAGGGAGRAAAVQCALDRCERLVLVNRTVDKAAELLKELRDRFEDEHRLAGPRDRIVALPWTEKDLERESGEVDLIINATSLGMKASDPEVVPRSLIRPHHLVYDMVYSPPRTRLIAEAEGEGARASNGLGMLLWQGALAFEFWFNREAPVAAMRAGLMA